MFGGKKKAPAPPGGGGGRGRTKRANMPLLMDVPGMDMGNLDDMLEEDGDDADLEAELADLVGGGNKQPRRKPRPNKPEVDLESMVASCMKEYGDDDEMSDTEDPDLLAELQGLDGDGEEDDPPPAQGGGPVVEQGVGHSVTETIQDRLRLYREAEQVAKNGGDTSRARRFNRGLKTLVELEKRALSGRPISEDEIPPLVTLGRKVDGPSSEASSATISPDSDQGATVRRDLAAAAAPALAPRPSPTSRPPAHQPPTVAPQLPPKAVPDQFVVSTPDAQMSQESRIQAARGEFKTLALAAKSAGDKETALANMRQIKICDALLAEVRAGHTVDLSQVLPSKLREEEQLVRQTPPPSSAHTFPRDEPIPIPEKEESLPAPDPAQYGAPPAPATIMEALHQRLDKYKAEESKAKEGGNSSKARRMGRICKQYQEAIAIHKAGRPIPRADLPDPPGFAPIPVTDQAPSAAPPDPAKPPTGSGRPAAAVGAGGAAAGVAGGSAAAAKGPSPPRTTLGRQASQAGSSSSVQSKQLEGLQKRQTMFKQAALQAKQQGQTDTAREYLRQALSFNKLIEVSKAGLPVDMGTLPVPPQMQVKTNMDFEIVSVEDCGGVTGDREEMFSKLEQDLIGQVKMCMTNRTYFKEVGDVASANKFEQMALHSKKDLDAIRFAFKRGDPVPKFHYETRAFSRVVCNTDLTDNDLELNIVTGINYTNKNQKDVPDTYVRWEFPFPRDAPTVDRTCVVKGSNNPEYNSFFKLVINPRDKGFQRVVKRGALKVEVWSKGGFLRSDILLGTASVKISHLETSCEIHDSFDLYDGRKPVGGKVEVKLRIRNGIIAKQIEQKQEKWLVVQF